MSQFITLSSEVREALDRISQVEGGAIDSGLLLTELVTVGHPTLEAVLAQLGVGQADVVAALNAGRKSSSEKGVIGMSPEARSAIELATEFAFRQNRASLDASSLLVGLALSEGSLSQAALGSLGITPDRIIAAAE